MGKRSTASFVGFPDIEPTINGLSIRELDTLAQLALEFIDDESLLDEFSKHLRDVGDNAIDRSKLKTWWSQKKESRQARKIREREEYEKQQKQMAALARKGARLLRRSRSS